MGDICGDNRFKIIAKAKEDILSATNIESSPEEMQVLDNFLFRCWQMGWLEGNELSIEEDGSLFLDLPVDVTKVKRVIIRQEGTDLGNVYYLEDNS